MLRRGLVEGTSGNISARLPDGNIVCTPSSVDYSEMVLNDLVVVSPGGEVVFCQDGRSPTSELQLHLACYRAFDDVGSVDPRPSGVGHHVRLQPRASPRVRRRVHHVYRRGGALRRLCHVWFGRRGRKRRGRAARPWRRPVGQPWLGRCRPSPAKVLHIVALVERTAQIAWGARALGGVVPIPEKVNQDFAGVYQLMRAL